MMNNHNNDFVQNDVNGNVQAHIKSPTAPMINGATVNGTSNGNAPQQLKINSITEKLWARWDTFADFCWFIICSVGFILLEIYYVTFGYPTKELNNDVALITGGGNGLGRLLALRLGKMGTKVIVWDINEKGIKETVNMVEDIGGYCKGYAVDISKKEEIYKAADVIRSEIGDVTLLINNAGVVSGLHLLETPDYLIERSFNVNVIAHFWTSKAFLPKMIEKKRGHIVTIASLAGHVGITKLVDYCASKFAAVGFDEALRLELDVLGHTDIQTTCICPFFIQATGMFDDVNARWVPTLNSNEVADRVIEAIKKNEKIAVIPGFLKYMMGLKWFFPWGCTAGFLRRLVPDAAPHATANKISAALLKQNSLKSQKIENLHGNIMKMPESTPTILNNGNSTTTNRSKAASLLIQRTPSLGERVL